MSDDIEKICMKCRFGRLATADEKRGLGALLAGFASGTESNIDFIPELVNLADAMLNLGGAEESMYMCEHPRVSSIRNSGPGDGLCFTTWQESDPDGGPDIRIRGFESK